MLIVIGDKEAHNKSINVRRYGQDEQQSLSLEDFVQAVVNEIASKSR